MISILIIIAVFSASFTTILEKEDLLLRRSKPTYLFSWISVLLAVCAFILFYNYPETTIFIIPAGIIYLGTSLIYMEVWARHYRLNHFAIHSVLVFIISALSQRSWGFALIFPFIFIAAYFLFTFILGRLVKDSTPLKEDVLPVFELNRILSGLYLLILGLALAGNGIRFFWRIADFLF